MKLISLTVTGYSLLLLLLAGSQTTYATPRFERVAVAPIAIEVAPITGAPLRSDGNALVRRLSLTATDAAVSNLMELDLARIVERATPTDKGVIVTGSVQLPLSLPPGVIGLRAFEREGTFATAQITFRDATGQVLASGTVALKWNAVHWLTGAHKTRRNRALDDVLQDFVRRGVKDALTNIAQRLATPPLIVPMPVMSPFGARGYRPELSVRQGRMAALSQAVQGARLGYDCAGSAIGKRAPS